MTTKIGPNSPCPCGSGKKHKKCCAGKASVGVNTQNANAASALLLEGLRLHQANRIEDAERIYRRILASRPRDADALHYLGLAAYQLGRPADAVASIGAAIEVNRRVPAYHCNLGNALKRMGELERAEQAYTAAVELDPNFVAAWFNLGNTLLAGRKFAAAVTAYRRALALQSAFPEAWHWLGAALAETRAVDEARSCFATALKQKTAFPEALFSLGDLEIAAGRVDSGMSYLREAIRLKPDLVEARQAMLMALNYTQAPQAEILAAHREFGQRLAGDVKGARRRYDSQRQRIRIGYLSPDFRQHSVAHFIAPILRLHDRSRFEVFAYSCAPNTDAMTERLRADIDAWRDITALSDAAARALIESDEIDVLVDLAGHTRHNRIGILAAAPAPILVTYLGYPNTTGLTTVDYRITDEQADPPGGEVGHVERLARIEGGFLCYEPAADEPAIVASPCLARGFVTFGSFNALAKLSAATIALWAKLLQQLPDSRLLLKSAGLADSIGREHLLAAFGAHGIDTRRLDLIGFEPSQRGHLDRYGNIDIALDSFPYHGTTTTCEALRMGVPVVTLAGDRHAARVGVSLLSRCGLSELIAADADQYVAIAKALASDPERLQKYRVTIRDAMAASALMDAPRLVRKLEVAYLEMLAESLHERPDGSDGQAPA